MFQNKILIICTTFNFPNELNQAIQCILSVLNSRNDTYCTVIDNLSKDEKVHEILDNINHKNLSVIKKNMNIGKAMVTNHYLKETLNHENCPRVVISMDPDVKFDVESFNKLIDALDTVPKLGMLAMRFLNNKHNPERSLLFPAKKIKAGKKEFYIKQPLFANVAGPLFGVQGYVLSHYLNFQLFPKSNNQVNIEKGYIKRAGSDDAFLYDHLKKHRLIQGYLEGTQIEHLKSPPQTENYIK